ncbi:DUF927 domain-containing protein [Methanococcoides sp. FTZ1]|uniref:DUF927 domain-containing protein n=1 Tax=Methanococcoides sp. FTZ1 TaxID=3439061 RepID=UPI003F84B050
MTSDNIINTEDMEGEVLTEGNVAIKETIFDTSCFMPEGYAITNKKRENGVGGKLAVQKLKYIDQDGKPVYNIICRTPCMITGKGKDPDDGELWLKLSYFDPSGKEKDAWIRKGDMFSRKRLYEALENHEFVIDEKNIGHLIEYLTATYDENYHFLKNGFIAKSNGWKEDTSCFVFGDKMYCANGVQDVIIPDKEAIKGLTKIGTPEQWVEANKELLTYTNVRFICYSAMSAILLRLLGTKSNLVDLYGESSGGKSITDGLGMSLIGSPTDLVINGNSTNTAIEVLVTRYSDLPICIDETSTANPKTLGDIIYMIANEKGKSRGHKNGGLRKTNEWKCVALTNGERPITSTEGFTGQKVRTIELYGGIGNNNLEKIVDNAKVSNESKSYGHIIEPFLTKLFSCKDELEILHHKYKTQFPVAKDNVNNRMINHFATITVAGKILEEVYSDMGIEPVDPFEITSKIYDATVINSPIEKHSVVMLRELKEWITSENAHFMTDIRVRGTKPIQAQNKQSPLYGWIARNADGDEVIDIIPRAFNEVFLGKENKNKSTVLKNEWKEVEVLETNRDKNGNPQTTKTGTHATQVNGKATGETVYRFNSKKMDEILGIEKEIMVKELEPKYEW